jgi:hypothetical protein
MVISIGEKEGKIREITYDRDMCRNRLERMEEEMQEILSSGIIRIRIRDNVKNQGYGGERVRVREITYDRDVCRNRLERMEQEMEEILSSGMIRVRVSDRVRVKVRVRR